MTIKTLFNKKNKKSSSHMFNKKGDILVFALIFMSIFLVLSAGLLGVVSTNRKFTLRKVSQGNALEIAEAGINYYKWHIAHNPHDYRDGQGEETCALEPPHVCGPYIHNYLNDSGQKIGAFTLQITPPVPGSTIITVQSTGAMEIFPNIQRTVSARIGIPSLAEYSFLEDSPMNFSATSETWGKIHSNYRIQFNGISHSTVESAEPVNGVWGAGGPQDLWHWPVPAIDFNKITQDLSLIKTEAQINGIYLPKKSNREGYHLNLKADNTMDVYEVETVNSYNNITLEYFSNNESLDNIHIIFIEQDTWVEGVINDLITIASARFPDQTQTNTTIYIADNITYINRDEQHVLGLIAQKNIIVTQGTPNDTVIEAHLLAQKGSVNRPFYSWWDLKNSLTIYGGVVSKTGGGFKWLSGSTIVSGFINTYYEANPNAIYNPPPMFPISSTSTLISWEELE